MLEREVNFIYDLLQYIFVYKVLIYGDQSLPAYRLRSILTEVYIDLTRRISQLQPIFGNRSCYCYNRARRYISGKR